MPEAQSDNRTWLLALDSSTDQAGICLTDNVHTAELSWDARRNQTTTLLSAVDQLMTLQRIEVANLAAVAVATGPGAFSSLRVGLSIAKGLAYAWSLPLIGVPTLDAAARAYATAGADLVVVLAAGRSRLVWASYGVRDGSWQQLKPPFNGDIARLVDELQHIASPPRIMGEFDQAQRARLEAAGFAPPPPPLSGRQPAGLATIARERLDRGEIDDPATLSPMYLHGSSVNANDRE